MTGALTGIKVLDLSQGAAGPTCAQSLGDLGATVYKVEPPGGEWGRGLGPPFVDGVAASYLGMNRNKVGIAVDLKAPGASAVVLRLAARCDVVIESFRPGVADRLGVGYEAVAETNPRVVYASISAFGQFGPWRNRPGVDGVAQAMGGIMSVTGSADGPPVKVGVPAADMAAGIYAAQSILAALFSRERTGRGQKVDVSLLDSLLAYQTIPLSMFLASNEAPVRLGSAAPYASPNQVYPTADGHIMVAAYVPKRWRSLCRVLGQPDLETDQRFDTNEKRVADRTSLNDVLDPLFRARTTAEWLAILDEADILCGPLLTYPELVAEDHVIESRSLVSVTHPALGEIRSPRFPGRLSDTPCGYDVPPPFVPGEQTETILAECGFDSDQIENLYRDGIVAGPRQEAKHE